MDQRSELRLQECHRIRQHRVHHIVRKSVEPRHHTVVARLERCCDGRVKVIGDGVDDRGVGSQEKVGARWHNSHCAPLDVGEPSVRILSGCAGPLQ